MIYLDHAATSPLLPEVATAMADWVGVPANPASVHAPGRRAAAALEAARAEVAAFAGRDPRGLVFCSGATEANHTAIAGFVALGARRVAASPIEHPSLLAAVRAAPEPVWLAVSSGGVASVAGVKADVLALMAVNHEVGTVQPLEEAAVIALDTGARLVVDATQGVLRVALPPTADAVIFSAHKLGGPVGIGALSLLSGDAFPALLSGGGQERGRRAGTANVAAAVGFAAACAAALRDRALRAQRHRVLAEILRRGLVERGGRIVGDASPRTDAITCAIFEDIPADLIVAALDLSGIAVSAGSACASGSVGSSPVLEAMGEEQPRGGVRMSLGQGTSEADIGALLLAVDAVLPAIRAGLAFQA